MADLDIFLELPLTEQVAVICFSLCATTLFLMLMFAPRRNCLFFKWHAETRFFAFVFSPVLLIVWPIVLYGLFLKSRGITADDPDFLDD